MERAEERAKAASPFRLARSCRPLHDRVGRAATRRIGPSPAATDERRKSRCLRTQDQRGERSLEGELRGSRNRAGGGRRSLVEAGDPQREACGPAVAASTARRGAARPAGPAPAPDVRRRSRPVRRAGGRDRPSPCSRNRTLRPPASGSPCVRPSRPWRGRLRRSSSGGRGPSPRAPSSGRSSRTRPRPWGAASRWRRQGGQRVDGAAWAIGTLGRRCSRTRTVTSEMSAGPSRAAVGRGLCGGYGPRSLAGAAQGGRRCRRGAGRRRCRRGASCIFRGFVRRAVRR